MPSRRRLQQYAVAVSIISVFYNTAEGVVSIVFGAESSSRSLVFYGIQSAVEVISALMVTWRFVSVIRPGQEDGEDLSIASTKVIKVERIATTCIGSLLIALALAALATSAASLVARESPTTALPSLIIAGSATGIMAVLWLIKRYLARALNSSTMNGEALCALECMQLSAVLLIGSLIYHFWRGGWWVDSATAIVIGLLFGWEGVKMVRWARNENFDGGCCEDCHSGPSKDDDEALRHATPPIEKREASPSSCSASSGCCGGSKDSAKESCSSRKINGDEALVKCEKKEASRDPSSTLRGCCGNSTKKPIKEDCCSSKNKGGNKELSVSPCSALRGCCGSSKEESPNEDCCSRKQNGDETTPMTVIPPHEKKEVSQSRCGASSRCCGGSKKG